jgi:hypothetical protein
MLLTYFLNDFEMVPVAPNITGITFVFTFHMRYISIVRSLYIRLLLLLLLLLFINVTQKTLKVNWRETQNVSRLSNMHFDDKNSVFWVVVQTVIN